MEQKVLGGEPLYIIIYKSMYFPFIYIKKSHTHTIEKSVFWKCTKEKIGAFLKSSKFLNRFSSDKTIDLFIQFVVLPAHAQMVLNHEQRRC